MKCSHCNEDILQGEGGTIIHGGPFQFHRECEIRVMLGSSGHQLGLCSCSRKFGDTEEDPPGLNLRQAARAAWIVFRCKQAALTAIRRMQEKQKPAEPSAG